MKKEKEDWNEKGIMTKESVDKLMENLGHFTFKITNSNAISGGLRADKVELDGYVCMSNTMIGLEYDILNNPAGNAKVYKRVNAVIEGREHEVFLNVNANDVLYIRKKLTEINGTQKFLNLNVSNKRLKQIIIQDENQGIIENKELVILRSSGFSKVLSKALKKEREEKANNETVTYRYRKMAQMSFGGTKPLNIGVNGYLMSNVLYFNAPVKHTNSDFDEAYRLHHSGINLYDLVSIDFLKTYWSYLARYNQKNKINTYMKEEEKYLITALFTQMKNTVKRKYELLDNNKEHFPNNKPFSDNLLNSQSAKLLAFGLVDKSLNDDFEDVFINCLLAILHTKTFYLEKNKPLNLIIANANETNIRKTVRELLWQNI